MKLIEQILAKNNVREAVPPHAGETPPRCIYFVLPLSEANASGDYLSLKRRTG